MDREQFGIFPKRKKEMGKNASFFILHHLILNGSEAFCPVCKVMEIFMAPLCVHRHTYPNNILSSARHVSIMSASYMMSFNLSSKPTRCILMEFSFYMQENGGSARFGHLHKNFTARKLQLLFSLQVMSNSFSTPGTVAHQAPRSMGFPRQEYWSGLPFLSPGDLPDLWIKPTNTSLAGRFFIAGPSGKPQSIAGLPSKFNFAGTESLLIP